MLKKLKWKFVLVTMSIVLAMLGVIFGLVYHFTKTDLENTSYATLQRLAQTARQPIGFAEPPRDVPLPYFIVYINGFGEIGAIGHTQHDLTDTEFLWELMAEVAEQGTNVGVLDEYAMMFHYEQGTTGIRLVFLDISSYNATLRSLVHSGLIIGGVSILVFFALSVLLSKWMLRPVERSWQQQKQFVSDASHELKTPLTVIMSNAELMQGETLPANRDKYAQNILTMSRQMRNLVGGLLELARTDNGQVRKNFEKLDMSRLVTDSVLPFEPVYYERNLLIKTDIQEGIVATGNAGYLRQVVDILLDNARKYADEGLVVVRLQRRGKQCMLTVANPGTPIPDEEQEKIFDRFYRADEARSQNGSFGLGLSIAKSVVTEHRGKIWVVSNPTGNCFCVQLPCE